jgi:hypothetical protein
MVNEVKKKPSEDLDYFIEGLGFEINHHRVEVIPHPFKINNGFKVYKKGFLIGIAFTIQNQL